VEEIFLPAIQRAWGKDVEQAETHTAEPLVPDPSASKFELAIDKLKVTYLQVLTKYQQN